MKILIAADGSAYTKRMLAYVAAHDEWLGSAHDYTVMHCMPDMPPHVKAWIDQQTLDGYYADESEKVFKPIRTFFAHHGMQVRFLGRVGHAAQLIASLANEEGFDLVVMGSHGHGALANLVLGSVAAKVFALCKTPVLIVR